MKRFEGIISAAVIMLFIFSGISGVYAQSVNVLGEIKSTGKVFISSSNGVWLPAKASYPILENTGIKTEDGTAALYFRDGSRADVSKNSIASVGGSGSDFSIRLSKGVVAFNMTTTASLSVLTPASTVSVNVKNSPVQKVSLSKERFLGAIAVTEKGTEVRSISGRISVTASAGETRIVSTGESIFIGADSSVRVYKTQAVAQNDDDNKKAGAFWLVGDNGVAYGILGGIAVTTGTAFALGSHWDGDGEGRLASPSGFSGAGKK
jgi:hypothetical protein